MIGEWLICRGRSAQDAQALYVRPFTEGFGTPVLKQAKALLEELG
jgi:hypothetical protein